MKIAVCISGIPRSGVGANQEVNRDFQRNFNNIRKNFPGADFYIGTWSQYESEVKKEYPGERYWLFDEPAAHYHPYFDINRADMVSDKMYEYSEIFRKRQNLHERSKHQAKQIVCHANMVKNLPEKYDVIVRARFDTFTDAQANFSKYVDMAYKNKTVVGFACLKPHWASFNILRELDKNNPEHADFTNRTLFDPLIIHHGDNIDPDYILKLFEDKKLCPAEFGWYQVLSKPYNDNHLCISGWANADRCVLKQFLVKK